MPFRRCLGNRGPNFSRNGIEKKDSVILFPTLPCVVEQTPGRRCDGGGGHCKRGVKEQT